MTYRFVGALSELGSRKLEFFGQPIELSDVQANEAILGGVALMPDAQFQALGFTPDELKRYRVPAAANEAPAEFQEKRKKAWLAVHVVREKLEQPTEVKPTAVQLVKEVITNGNS